MEIVLCRRTNNFKLMTVLTDMVQDIVGERSMCNKSEPKAFATTQKSYVWLEKTNAGNGV